MKYKKIKLRTAQTHPSYKNPHWLPSLTKREKDLHSKVSLGEANLNEIKEFMIIKKQAIKTIRLRMKKLYDTVAAAEGFELEGNYFVKNI
jgi:DNA-binding CsgD family transcriptional regulator